MKYKIGDILCSKLNMSITINGDEENEDVEDVNESDFFVITNKKDDADVTVYTLLRQKTLTKSYWQHPVHDLERHFSKMPISKRNTKKS